MKCWSYRFAVLWIWWKKRESDDLGFHNSLSLVHVNTMLVEWHLNYYELWLFKWLSDCADKPLHWTFKILIRQISSLWLKPKSSSVHTGRLKPVCSAWSDREDGRQPVISQRGRSTSNLTIAYPHFVTWVVTCRVIPSAGGLSGVDHKWERGPGDGGGPGGGGRGEGGGHYRGARWSQGQAWGE